MPFQPIEPRRLYRQIADQLRQHIQRGEFPVGSKLPTERDLAQKLGVSRPSVREALIALEVEGLIEVRMSAGIFVMARESVRRVETSAHGPLETIRARQVLESELAAAAAQAASPGLVDGLAAALRQMREDIDRGVMPIAGDREFHLGIAQASDNSVLLSVVTQLFDERYGALFKRFGTHFERERTWRAAVQEHQAVLDAIAARDPAAARVAMQTHLGHSHDRFADVWPVAEPAAVAPTNLLTLP
ncbi:FadR/GntR family transcriptional regulator [Sphaerotilus sp.]|jgi:DNA-binding FadR family transcriptional regulator|uniref:FadR/GntR family transcriptional regulator n=1 Tax=Sphaerotilus sp. TaxID=2093942 RepID=UPI00286E546C|nr:FadR/GntR family transcriptional regulator [Sphaerotilus sp.]